MVKLFCAIVGAQGSAFPVDIDTTKSVDHLKDAIKAENKITLKNIDAPDLQLFLAKPKDGPWLRSDDSDVISMRSGAIPEQVKKLMNEEMNPAARIGDLFGDAKPTMEIHVLVRVPDYDSSEFNQQRKLTSLGKLLKQSEVSVELPVQGDFMKLFDLTDDNVGKVLDIKAISDIVGFTGSDFYIRKEILCVLENFKKTYHDELKDDIATSKQFILMGSPGTGKSCILAMICFYIAVEYGRPVVWFCHVSGGYNLTTTRLFYEGKFYEWKDENGEKYEQLSDCLEDNVKGLEDNVKSLEDNVKPCWFCLDGMTRDQIKEKNWLNKYKVLATSGQFLFKSDAAEFLELCLVPYWRQEDLEAIGKHKGLSESTMDVRFFKSGGSLRDFISGDFRIARAGLKAIEGSSHAESLLTGAGVIGDKLIDRIRMQGVKNYKNADHYVDTEMWTSCVTSRAVLNFLTHILNPNYFQKLQKVAKGMNDARLEGVALEGYFHSLVRHRRPFHVECCEYDNVNRYNWLNIMQKKYLIDCSPDEIKVESTGTNMEQCVAVMEDWAANPSKMDYWIPATSLCETIDAVAKWTFSDKVEECFCFLQLTMATKHKCNENVLWDLVEPFVKKNLNVCYIALLRDKENIKKFRLDPVEIKKQEIVKNVDLFVAHFEEEKQ